MAYVAIARKSRPQLFDEIIGQGHVTRTLCNAISMNRVHHAFLFTGARGVGKTSAARILAKALNCEKGPTPTPCNACSMCKDITAGVSQDVHEIDAASNTGVDNIREIRDNIRYLPSHGKFKIYIVDEVHMLSTAAFNALLKTLEEPPPHVVFIFATTDPQKVPETILSRCQRFDFKRIPVRQIADKLASIAEGESFQITKAACLMIAREAEGSMRDAESLLDQVLSAASGTIDPDVVTEVLGLIDRRLIFDCVGALLRREPARALEVVEQVYGFGFDMKQLTKELLEIVRHLNIVRIASEAERIVDVSADELELLRSLAESVTQDELTRHFRILLDGLDEVARSETPRLALEMCILRMAQVRPVLPMADLIDRLAGLERQLRRGGAFGRGVSGAGASGGGSPASGGSAPPPVSGPAALSGAAGERGSGRMAPAGSRGAHSASHPDGRPGARSPSSEASAGDGVEGKRSAAAVDASGLSGMGTSAAGPSAAGPSTAGPSAAGTSAVEASGGSRFKVPSSGDAGQAMSGAREGGSAPGRAVEWIPFISHLMETLEERDRPRFLPNAEVCREGDGGIELGVRKEMSLRRVEAELASARIREAASAFFGRPVDISCRLIEGDAPVGPSYAAFKEKRKRDRLDALTASYRSRPIVQEAVRILHVEPSEIRVEVRDEARRREFGR